MRLNELRDNPGARRPRKRVGRGMGSGTGKTAGRGQKGQKSRSGGGTIAGFEGGQMPLYRRLPKRGFKNPNRRDYVVINLVTLQKAVDAGKLDPKTPLDEKALVAAGLVRRRRDGIRLLAKGELKAKLALTLTGASKAAVEAVEKAGGSVTLGAGAGAAASDATDTKPAEKPKKKAAPDSKGDTKADSKADAKANKKADTKTESTDGET